MPSTPSPDSLELRYTIKKAVMQFLADGMICFDTAARLLALGIDVEALESSIALGEAV